MPSSLLSPEPATDTSVRVHRSAEDLPRERQLAHRIARFAAEQRNPDAQVVAAVGDRLIDNAAVAVAALRRRPVVNARNQALAHLLSPGATVVGCEPWYRVSPEWAAWANAVAVRELDMHDTYLAADYAHPADAIPAVLAVAQHCQLSGADLARGIACSYEVQITLTDAICLHRHRIDHIAHLAPAAAAGIGSALGLSGDTIHQAVQQAAHVSTTTRQSRKGEISSWKAYAPAFAGKMAVEAIDRAMRGEGSPTPVYEGEDGIIAWLLDGPGAHYRVELPEPGRSGRAILRSYTKEHSAEYQAQALIDLSMRLAERVGDTSRVRDITIHTSHHTHQVIGTGSADPQKLDPSASRETLDHSLAYIVAVALQDRAWHHESSYAPSRAARPDTIELWRRVRTVEDPHWTQRYHHPDPEARAFGGRMVITLDDGAVIEDEIAVADAHPRGADPFDRRRQVDKFTALCDGVIAPGEQRRFLEAIDRVTDLPAGALDALNLRADPDMLAVAAPRGLFDR